MNANQLRLLSNMKRLVKQGKRRFENRPDYNYLDELLNLGISVEEAWNVYVLSLNKYFYFPDPKPSYYASKDTLTFKREVNGNIAYIKLKLEHNNGEDETVCISFHSDRK